MEQQYDFDKVIDRKGTDTCKWENCQDVFGTTDLLPLWIADMDFEVCPDIAQALLCRIGKHPNYGYSCAPKSYWQSIIDWLRHRHNFEVSREELTYIPGIVKGVAMVQLHFTKPGDKVVIQPPVYHPFAKIIEGNGRQVLHNPLIQTEDGLYRMDLPALEQIFETERPPLMIITNPHNPAGIAWDRETLSEVARLAHKYGVIVVSDEIHCDLVLRGRKHIPFATVSDEARQVSITFGAPSKSFNIAGIVSSWCVIKNPEIRKPFYNWLCTNELNATNFLSTIATEAAYTKGEAWLNQCIGYIEDNIDFVQQYCAQHIPGIRAIAPQASFLMWLDCADLDLTHEQVIDLFVHKAKLGLNDGAMFGPGGALHMRLNVATPRSVLTTALHQLAEAVNNR